MAAATLPPSLRTQMDRLAGRLRRLTLIRGSSVVLLTAVVGAAVAMGLDAAFALPPILRIGLTAAWLGAIAVVTWRTVSRMFRQPVSATALAAAVEDEYPLLDERLTSAIEVTATDRPSGSPAFVELLVRETERKTRALDFHRAAPPYAAGRRVAVAGVAIALVTAAALYWPDESLGLGRRLVMPWDRRPAVMPFEIAVRPGDAFAPRGRPLTVDVELRRARDNARIPDTCTLILTAADGKPLRLRMPAGTEPHAFAFRIDDVRGDYRYRVEAGGVESDDYSLRAVEPVDLAGMTTTLTPPAYATSVKPQSVDGPADLSILRHGRISIDCRFDRPAEVATLIVTPANGDPKRWPLGLADDRRGGHVVISARTDARLRLELDAEHGITTQTPEQTLTVTPDRPPEFRHVTGLPERAETRPNDALAINLTVADDLAVAEVVLEYRVNAGPVVREPVALSGLGTPSAAGRAEFKLAGKVKDGDRLYVRLRAADNRNVPDIHVGPNVVTFPAEDRWCELQVAADAEPVRRQEIAIRRDDIERRLREVIDQVDKTTGRTDTLAQAVSENRSKPDEQARESGALTAEQSATTKLLADLARDADVGGLVPLAEAMQAVGEVEFRRASEAFADAAATPGPPGVSPLKQAQAALTDARVKLEGLLKENQALADLRLSEVKLDELADRERDLAGQTNDATTPEERDRLSAEQRKIAEELDQITHANEKLREAMRASQAAETRKLAEQAKKLAQQQRDLDAKLREAERARNVGRLAGLARRQQDLAAEAGRFATQTQPAAKTAKADALNPEAAAKAARDLQAGDADQAVRAQNQSAREIDRLADDLQKGVDTATDPREAARQLSRLQDENRDRLRNRPAERPLARREQDAIQTTIKGLNLPDDNTAARRERQQATEFAAEAAQALTRNADEDADLAMGRAKAALDRLVNDLPTTEQRLRRARGEAAALRTLQDGIGRMTDRAAAAVKQADVAARLGKLDAPGQEARRARAAEAAAHAYADLTDRTSADVDASQAAARRAVERLAEALAGKTPADEKARQLARQQREVAAAVAAGADAAVRGELERKQEQIANDALGLNASEAPVRQSDAGQAAVRANTALRAKPTDATTRQKLEDAAEALDQLADQLAGRESQAERAERLARKQETLAEQPPANPVDARRQATQIAEEAKQVRAGGPAAQAKRGATEALARLTKWPPGTPANLQAQKDAAHALRKLADEMNRNASAKAPPSAPETSDNPDGMPTPEQVRQARQLAAKQRELRDQVRKAMGDDRPPPADQDAADRAQKEIADKAADLAKSLDETADKLPEEQAQQSARSAADSARQGEQSSRQARGGEPGRAKDARRRTAEALDKAAEQAMTAAEPGQRRASPNGRPEEVPSEAGQSLQDAKGEMSQAQEKLGRGQAKPAGSSMDRAADALRNAADQVGRRNKPADGSTKPADAATAGQSPPKDAPLPPGVREHAGKKWGELPGELRTRIVQEMKAQYGDDYARVIKLYFEQIAETGTKK